MLSRVKERKGLFLASKINEKPKNYCLDENLLSIIGNINNEACLRVKEEDRLN